jgi:L-aminopeptidase/D-esterase-like protein
MRVVAATDADFSRFGIAVGHATDDAGATGCSVVRGIAGPMRAAATVIGRATGSREMLPLTTNHLVDRVDAIFLTGGSAYGLDAAAGVMRWMEERGRGFPVAGGVVPIVPAAVVFDLMPLGTFTARPTAAMAYAACESARSASIEEGSVGAGTGTTVGKAAGPQWAMKGGFGCAVTHGSPLAAGAMVVVNALGDVRDENGRIIAGARAEEGFRDSVTLLAGGAAPSFDAMQLTNTTLAVVAFSAAFSRVELGAIAEAAGAALHRRITPAGTAYDGDIVFAVSPIDGPAGDVMNASVLATAALEHAIERAVRTARGRDGIPGLGDRS